MRTLKNIFFVKYLLMIIAVGTLIISISSCEEKADNHIFGIITDMSTQEPVPGVSVSLYITEIKSGSVSGAFKEYLTTTTDADGKYNFEFESLAVGEYSIRIAKNGYHSNYEDFMPLETAAEYEKNINIPKAAYIHFTIHNAYGQYQGNEEDAARIIVEGINPDCKDCCSSDYYSFDGLNVDEDFVCNIVAGDKIKIRRYLIRNGASSNREKDYVCEQNDTIEFIWNY